MEMAAPAVLNAPPPATLPLRDNPDVVHGVHRRWWVRLRDVCKLSGHLWVGTPAREAA